MTYYNVGEIETVCQNFATVYPTLARTVPLPEATFEGRRCLALHLGIGMQTPQRAPKKTIMILGGLHAREWGSCEIVVNLAADLLAACQSGQALNYGIKSFLPNVATTLFNGLDIVLFPLVNPDGRHYSQSQGKWWRKNRTTAYAGGDAARIGVDINRNFDFLFDVSTKFSPNAPVQVSVNPNNSTYQGPAAFSEPETRNVRWLLEQFPTTRALVDLHASGQTVIYNWSHDETQAADPAMNFMNAGYDGQRGVLGDPYMEYLPAADLALMQGLAQQFVTDAGAVRTTKYVAQQASAWTIASGTSHDYAYSRHLTPARPPQAKVYGFAVEWGDRIDLTWNEMLPVIGDVCAGLVGFCVAASATVP